jgi:hypothetical protein
MAYLGDVRLAFEETFPVHHALEPFSRVFVAVAPLISARQTSRIGTREHSARKNELFKAT